MDSVDGYGRPTAPLETRDGGDIKAHGLPVWSIVLVLGISVYRLALDYFEFEVPLVLALPTHLVPIIGISVFALHLRDSGRAIRVDGRMMFLFFFACYLAGVAVSMLGSTSIALVTAEHRIPPDMPQMELMWAGSGLVGLAIAIPSVLGLVVLLLRLFSGPRLWRRPVPLSALLAGLALLMVLFVPFTNNNFNDPLGTPGPTIDQYEGGDGDEVWVMPLVSYVTFDIRGQPGSDHLLLDSMIVNELATGICMLAVAGLFALVSPDRFRRTFGLSPAAEPPAPPSAEPPRLNLYEPEKPR